MSRSVVLVGMPLLVHGEVTHADIDIFDREVVFIDTVLEPLRKDFPQLKIVFEHITTKQAAHYVRDAATPSNTLAATITPQHLLMNRNAIFSGGIRPHNYCFPVPKARPGSTAKQIALGSAGASCQEGTTQIRSPI